ncbi:hypothetical protein G3M48_002788 [Beauveria asiatica]|uniref:Uncharacterized protein n=1 Tax=Beauveria asiatica TaxID=1069075 RepID=A0AAW0RET0_9HYPO
MLRRSLQTPDPDKPYLTEGHDVIDMIEEALARDKKGKGFLDLKIEKLSKLEGKLLAGVNPSQRERKFVKALRLGGLYDEWLEASRWQAKEVLEKTEPL